MNHAARTKVLAPHGLAGEYAAVLLDLDGTLVDSRASVDRAWRSWCGRYDVEPRELTPHVHGRTAADVIRRIRPSWPDDLVAAAARFQLRVQERDDEPGTAAPGARDLLGALADGHRWAVVTACSARLARHRLTRAGLPGPPVLVAAEDTVRGKPDPQPYLAAARRLAADPADCLAVEDAPAGVRSARAAGCAVAAVATTHPADDLPDATAVVEDLTRLVLARRHRP
ncbi:HAD-IA family hydrolase [Streptomyces capparidis]